MISVRKEIELAQQQLKEKASELEREKDTTRALSEKLQSAQSQNNQFDDLMSQNRDILEKLEMQHLMAHENSRAITEEPQAK